MNRSLLVRTESSPGEILFQAYKYEKSKNSNFSMQYICNHCEIPSRSHLSDVMKGRRKIKKEYIKKVFSFLGFSREEVEVIQYLCQLEKTKKIEQREEISEKVLLSRKRLNICNAHILGGDYNPFIFVKAFCSLGIKDLKPTAKEISLIIRENEEETQKALDNLILQGWISKKDEYYSYDKNFAEVAFSKGDKYEFHLKHIELATQDGLNRLRDKFNDKENTYFESTTLSVELPFYQNFLKKFKSYINTHLSELETGKADNIIHLNFLVYPEDKVLEEDKN